MHLMGHMLLLPYCKYVIIIFFKSKANLNCCYGKVEPWQSEVENGNLDIFLGLQHPLREVLHEL